MSKSLGWEDKKWRQFGMQQHPGPIKDNPVVVGEHRCNKWLAIRKLRVRPRYGTAKDVVLRRRGRLLHIIISGTFASCLLSLSVHFASFFGIADSHQLIALTRITHSKPTGSTGIQLLNLQHTPRSLCPTSYTHTTRGCWQGIITRGSHAPNVRLADA